MLLSNLVLAEISLLTPKLGLQTPKRLIVIILTPKKHFLEPNTSFALLCVEIGCVVRAVDLWKKVYIYIYIC